MTEQPWPAGIRRLTEGRAYTRDAVGMSGSGVFLFDDMVLKVGRRDEETDNEERVLRWLNGRLPAAETICREEEDGCVYALRSRLNGIMLCDEAFLRDPERLVRLVAEGLRLLWRVDAAGCPDAVSWLSGRLRQARLNVDHGLVDMADAEPETFAPGGFADPRALLEWLEQNRPAEDVVFTHGDFCLPNILAEGERITGFIDLGRAGAADRWQDIALALRSLRHNFDGTYTDGRAYPGYDEGMLLRELGIPMDEEKYRYYLLLDELF